MNASGTSSVVKWAAWLAFAAVVGVVAARFVPQLTEPEVIRGRLVEGTELQVIFLVSPSCAVCTSSEFTQLGREVMEGSTGLGLPPNHRLTTVFVGLGQDPEQLFQWAADFGEFDELILGHGWVNLGAMRYVWRDLPGLGATPQILITSRELSYNEHARGIAIPDERVLKRLIGLPEIRRWVSSDFPIPGLSAADSSSEPSSDEPGDP